MAFKAKLPLLLFLFSLCFLLSATSSLANYERDPQQELEQCRQLCQRQQRFRQEQCEKQCEERYKERQREEGRGNTRDPQQEYQQCQHRCQQQEKGQRQCVQQCEDRRREQEREQQRDEHDPQREYQQCQSRCQQQERGQQQQRQCQQQCEDRRREQEREQQRGEHDPQREYQQCQSRCQQQERSQQQQCQQQCEDRRREQEREQQRDEQQERGQQQQLCKQHCEDRRREQEREQQRDEKDPQKEYQQCQSRCQQQERGQQQKQQCQQHCEDRRREQEREQQRDEQDPHREYQECQSRCQQQERGQQQQQQCKQHCEDQRRSREQEQQQGNSPYFFDEQSFIDRYRTQEGSIRVLPRFTERSNLLRGIENYRLAIFEANPNTFAVPNHWDADAVLFVVKGRGTISLVRQQNRESYNLKQGDVLRVPVGSLVYLINRDNNERLQIAKLFQTVSTPGQFREFFGAGGEEPESFYRSFSNDILETAFNTPREKLDRLFGKQSKGVIIKASHEQIRELSRHASSSSEGGHHLWPRGGDSHQSSQGPYNLLNKRPSHSNNYGQLYEVDGNDYRQLRDLDVSVSFTNISQGAMLGPYYNSRATKVILVVEGSGTFEMACPHLSRQSQQQHQSQRSNGREEQQEEEGGASYQRVSARLSPRTVFVVPAGHPVAIIASQNQNLHIVAFGINGQDNQRNFLAGRESVINQIEKEAMELGFNVPASEVKEILSKQRESYFLPGPNQRQQREDRGRFGSSLSILDFVGF
ncbi:Cupin 1 [Macleaya cordata]|uniref:Cupin 1 n=1 Tax=Macleaya cordata TaxID=56857 RepID=A0A200Q4L5_MACCD|nr:Cupin 1 [Macleaya cordata]